MFEYHTARAILDTCHVCIIEAANRDSVVDGANLVEQTFGNNVKLTVTRGKLSSRE